MNIVEQFNNLDGTIATRQELEAMLMIAEKQGHVQVVDRLYRLLNSSPDVEEFHLEVNKDYPSVDFLGCLDYENNLDDGDGLGRVSPNDIYAMITEKMVALVKKATGGGYKKTWKDRNVPIEGYAIPLNFVTKKPYRGINVLLLKDDFFSVFQNPYFLTLKQIESLKGKLKKGSKGRQVIYYTSLYRVATDGLNFGTYDKTKMLDFLKKEGMEAKFDILVEKIPILRYYNVFNGADIEGIDFDLENLKLGKVESTVASNADNEIASSIVENYPKPKVTIRHGGDRAFYSSKDYIQVPSLHNFDTTNDYYRTLFHEMIHSTGHYSRLDREMGTSFGSKKYAKEELVAEFGAIFLSAWAGIIWYGTDNHAEYLKNWANALKIAKDDNRFLLQASSLGQSACDFILNYDKQGNPAFYKNIGLGATAQHKDTVRFNQQILKAKKGGLELRKVYVLGDTKNILKEYLGDKIINVSGTVLNKAMTKDRDHIATLNSFINLPDYINNPIAIFNSKTQVNSKVVLTEIVNYKRKPLMVALHFEDKGKTLRIASIYSKTNIGVYEKWYNEGLCEYLDTKKSSNELLPGLIPLSHTVKRQHKDTKNIETNKKNLSLPDVEIEVLTSEPQIEKTVHEKDSQTVDFDETMDTAPKSSVYLPKLEPKSKGSLAEKLQQFKTKQFEYYTIENEDLSRLLGNIERKTKESVVITIAGSQGSMKTRFAFQFINAMARHYKVGHASIEEHPESSLYYSKAIQYIDVDAMNNVTSPEISSLEDLHKLIEDNDVIVIDSYAKLKEIDSKFELDKDLRKKYDGKLFLLVYQQTTNGSMRGGSKSQFDGDIILMVQKENDYKNNFIYNNKNRYNSIPLNELHYNIHNMKTYNPEESTKQLEHEQSQEYELVV